MLLRWFLIALIVCGYGLGLSVASAQEKSTAADRASRPLVSTPTVLSLEEARVIIDAATAVVRADKGRAAIAVVDYNGNLVSLDTMDGTSGFWVKFAIGKAMGAAALQQTTAESAEQYQTIRNVFTARSACSAAR